MSIQRIELKTGVTIEIFTTVFKIEPDLTFGEK
jgi:hypothetical protein